jgi:hypothetical protein
MLYGVEKRREKGAILTALGMAPGFAVPFLWRESGGFGGDDFPCYPCMELDGDRPFV